MQREFLQNLKVGDQALPKEVIDAIMEENGRDIEAAKKPFADYDSIKAQLQTARDGLKAFDGVDVKDLQGKVQKLQDDLDAKDKAHQAELAELAFNGTLKDAIAAAKGKNAGAIIGALGAEKVAALKESKDQTKDIAAALEGLKKDNGYLFESEQTPPPFAAGAGSTPPPAGAFNFAFTGVRAKPATN